MQLYKNTLRPVMLSLAVFASPLYANTCGDVPTSPELVDGATATMEDLVANSQSVKAFIAEADTFLDCNEAFAKTDEFKAISADEQKKVIETNATLLKARNDIGENFNKEVQTYKAANPE